MLGAVANQLLVECNNTFNHTMF